MFMERTEKSLLEDPAIAETAPDAISRRDLSQEAFYHWTLKEIDEKWDGACLKEALKGCSGLLPGENIISGFMGMKNVRMLPGRKMPVSFISRRMTHRLIGSRLSWWSRAAVFKMSGT